jgi:hypothetical protein
MAQQQCESKAQVHVVERLQGLENHIAALGPAGKSVF